MIMFLLGYANILYMYIKHFSKSIFGVKNTTDKNHFKEKVKEYCVEHLYI